MAAGVVVPAMLILLIANGKEIDKFIFSNGGFFGFLMVFTVVLAIFTKRW